MPIHDWSRVEAGIFHHFHHSWIEEIARALNRILPEEYYALAEQYASKYGPDVLTLQGPGGDDSGNGGRLADGPPQNSGGTVVLAPPDLAVTAETDMEFYVRKQKVVAVRHVSNDRVIAVVEVVSKANKTGIGLEQFAQKATQLLDQDVHLLLLDLHPPSGRDPNGIHGYIWPLISNDDSYRAPPDKPLTLVAYEAGECIRAYVVPVAVGDTLRDMPLFLKPGGQVPVPLESTYQTAVDVMPRRWRDVLDYPARNT